MAEQTKIPIEKIELVVDYVVIKDDESLMNQNIDENTKIYMVAKNLEEIEINITCDGNQFEIKCAKPLNLDEIKKLIRQKVDNLNELFYYVILIFLQKMMILMLLIQNLIILLS